MKDYIVLIDGILNKEFTSLKEANTYARSLKNCYEVRGVNKTITVSKRITKVIKEFMSKEDIIVKASELM